MRLKTIFGGAGLLTVLGLALCLPVLAGTVGTPTVSPSALAAGLVGKQADLGTVVCTAAPYGAGADARAVADVTATAGSATITVGGGDGLTAADVGKSFLLLDGAGVGNATTAPRPLTGTIVAVAGTAVTLSAAPTASLSGAFFEWGTDNTPRIQAALTAGAGRAVMLPPSATGHYLLAGTLTVPAFTRLQGAFPPKASGQPIGSQQPTNIQTWRNNMGALDVTGGGGTAAAPATVASATVTFAQGASASGLGLMWPGQDISESVPVTYPWAFAVAGDDVTWRDCFFLNPYQMASGGTLVTTNTPANGTGAERLTADACDGQPLCQGIVVDNCRDTDRISNCHLWPFWAQPVLTTPSSAASEVHPVYTWQRRNAHGVEVLGADEFQFTDCFVYGYQLGYYLEQSANTYEVANGGAFPYGTFVNCSADGCQYPIYCDGTGFQGVFFEGGGFVAFQGDTANGSVQDSGANAAYVVQTNTVPANSHLEVDGARFWSGGNANVVANYGGGNFVMRGCKIQDWKGPNAVIPYGSGSANILIQNNVFQQAVTTGGSDVYLSGTSKGIVSGNLSVSGAFSTGGSNTNVIVTGNN